MSTPMSRAQCVALDAADPLTALREQFDLPGDAPGDVPGDGAAASIYLDGNSLGALPRSTAGRVARAVEQEWGRGLIGSWNAAGWIDLPQRVGDKIARLIGAAPGEVVVADSTSINLHKVLSLALGLAAQSTPARDASRRTVLSERSNFPTDLYIADGLARERGFELMLADSDEDLAARLDERVAVLMLTQVHYRSGRLHDLATLTAAAHAVGALVVWDLAHSAGALPIDLHAADADFAVGCGYKYFNGGPGAPAFVWAHPRHLDAADRLGLLQPLAGWMGHAAPFAFTPGYAPAPGARRFLCGTPPVLSLLALDGGVDTLLAAEPLGGMAALRRKSMALGDLFIAQVEARCAGHGLQLASPRDAARRGSQVSWALPGIGYAVMQALIARGVVGDFRAGSAGPAPTEDTTEGDLLRFGFAPLYTRYADVWDAAEQLADVLASGAWQRPEFQQRLAVT